MIEILFRLKDLIVKLLSVKILAAGMVTLLCLQSPASYGIIGLAIVAFMWTVVIGDRTFEKYLKLLEVAKK